MRHLLLSIALIAATIARAQVSYKESLEDFPNPERGFYITMSTRAGHFIPLNADSLKLLVTGPRKYGSARYAVYPTLLQRSYILDTFISKPLSQAFLDDFDHDMNAARDAGIKLILRFSYNNKTKTGDCPDIYKICPPYGDALKSIVLRHIAQLAPLFKKHADIIAVLQEGFIGIWGENFYTDYFGDPGKNGPGRVMDSSWNDRNDVLHALLKALPPDRMVQVRTPQIKQKYVGGPEAGISTPALTLKNAFSASDAARIGYHNDCFLSGPDDYGTYYDYGSSNTPQKEANLPLRKFLGDDSRYVPVGAETCDDAYSPQNDCAPSGHAEADIAAVHLSFLNSEYNNDVNNDWDSLGCIDNIKKRLGYRFVLRSAKFPAHATPGGAFTFTIKLDNVGYASPYNPRPVQLILKSPEREFIISSHADPRHWFTGPNQWQETLTLPKDIAPGKYVLLLNFPDKYSTIAKRPEYSIRLANDEVWEPATGYNNLHVNIKVARP
jgi:hypothetical protein